MEVVPPDNVEFTDDMAGSGDGFSMQVEDHDDNDSVAAHENQLDADDQTPAFDATPDQIGTPIEANLNAGNVAAAEAKRRSIIAMEQRPRMPSTADRMLRIAAGGTPITSAAAAAPDDEFGVIGEPPGPRALRKDIIEASLSSLGHNDDGHLVFTCVTLSSLSLVNVDALAQYVHLQKVLVDNNHLTTLAPLTQARSLVTVSASHNKLDEQVFEHLRGSSESLQAIDVSFNALKSLDGVSAFPFLHELNASNNSLGAITSKQVSGLRSLSTLRLSNNEIETIADDAFRGCNIRHLDLAQNGVTDLSALLPLSHCLLSLDCSDNNVMHFALITNFTKLASFNLAGNNAYDLHEVHSLAQLPLLRHVSLLGNPLCSLHHGIDAPIDDDAASDIVRADAPTNATRGRSGTNLTTAAAAAATLSNSTVRGPVAAASLAATVVKLSPEDEDQAEYEHQPPGEQYRLCVLYRAPNITHLDGVEVTPEELTRARNLQGGADRAQRLASQKKFLHSSGAPALSLRKSRRGNL